MIQVVYNTDYAVWNRDIYCIPRQPGHSTTDDLKHIKSLMNFGLWKTDKMKKTSE